MSDNERADAVFFGDLKAIQEALTKRGADDIRATVALTAILVSMATQFPSLREPVTESVRRCLNLIENGIPKGTA